MLYHVALGSNLGDRLGHLRAAVDALGRLGVIAARSSVWETAPVDSPPGAGDFLNAAVALESALDPRALLRELLAIERATGRLREGGERNAPRTLDLDLVLAGDRVVDERLLSLPHPRLHQRRFVLEPLCEIAAEQVHPVLHRSIRSLLAALPPDPAPPRRLPGRL